MEFFAFRYTQNEIYAYALAHISIYTCTCLRGGSHHVFPHKPRTPGVCAQHRASWGCSRGKGGHSLVFWKLQVQQGSWGPQDGWGRSIPTSGTPDEGRHPFYENSVGQGSIGASQQKRLLLHNRQKAAWPVWSSPGQEWGCSGGPLHSEQKPGRPARSSSCSHPSAGGPHLCSTQ